MATFARLTPDLWRDVCGYLPLPTQAALFVKKAPDLRWRRRWFVWRGPGIDSPQPFVFDTANECAWALAFLAWASRCTVRWFPVAHVTDKAVQAMGLYDICNEYNPQQHIGIRICRRAWPEWWKSPRQVYNSPNGNWWALMKTAPSHRVEDIHQYCRGSSLYEHVNKFREHYLRYYLEVVGIPIPVGTADAWSRPRFEVDACVLDIVRRAEV